METHLTKTTESHSPPPDPVDFQQTIGGSSPNSPPFPPAETQEDQGNPLAVPEVSNFQNLLCQDEDLESGPSYSLGIDNDSPGDEEQEKTPAIHLPISTLSGYSSSQLNYSCSEPLPASGDTKPSTSHLSGPWAKRSGSSSPVWLDEKPYMVGAGLANLGNTCFLNAVMQCFTHTVVLVQGLCSYDHAMPCDRNKNGLCVLCAFREQIEVSLASSGRVLHPWRFVNNLSYLSSSFQRYQQEDAHEFLQCFLNRLENCCSDSKTKDKTLAAHNDNFVKQSFGGRLVSKLKCCNCDHFSYTYEPSIDLSLEIENVNTLHTALESFTKVERIEDSGTKFTCENCKEEVTIEKQLILEQAPPVATFHLKRFKNNSSYVEKIDKSVEFPLELDLQPYTSSSRDSTVELKYDLYAIVVHIGFTSTSGHYYCLIRPAPDTWYKFDDSKVVRVREDYVLSQEAYILFYAKQGIPWFSRYMQTLKPFLDAQNSNTSPKSVLENVDTRTLSPSSANNHNHNVNETSDAADEICMECPNESRHDLVDGSKDKDETTVPLDSSNYSSNVTCKTEKVFSPSVLREKNLNQDEYKTNANNTPQTPPRSPSPDLYKEESPEVVFTIQRNHLKLVSQLSCKKQLKKDWEGSETKQARRLLKSLPSARGRKLLAVLEASHSEGSQNNKRRKRMQVTPHKDDSPSRTHQKTDLQSLMRPLAAGDSH